MATTRTIASLFAGLVLGVAAASCGAYSAEPGMPACQAADADPTFVQPPDLNQDSPQCYRAPDGHKVAVVQGGVITVREAGQAFRVGTMDYGNIQWAPASDGFAVADSLGSGQTNRFSFVDLAPRRPVMNRQLHEASILRFQATFHCRGAKWFANTWTDGWTAAGSARLLVQEGHMSEGCMPRGEMIGIIGDPRTGVISRVLSADQVRREWCTAAQRREFGYCYGEAEAAAVQR